MIGFNVSSEELPDKHKRHPNTRLEAFIYSG